MMQLCASPFDSEHYELPIGKLAVDRAEDVAAGLAEARARGFAVVFVRIPDAAADLAAAIPAAPLETLVTSTLGSDPAPEIGSRVAIEDHAVLASEADVAAVAELTARAITISHLHGDPRLPADRTRRLYAAWARNDVTGRAARTFVARDGGELLGYLAVVRSGRTAVIDLVAVEPRAHGRGIGSALLAHFVRRVRTDGLEARVGTQSDNPALALYRRFGFVPTDRHRTYHVWL